MKIMEYIRALLHGKQARDLSEFKLNVDTTKPIHIPDELVTWEGKDQGMPRPPIIWIDRND